MPVPLRAPPCPSVSPSRNRDAPDVLPAEARRGAACSAARRARVRGASPGAAAGVAEDVMCEEG